MGKPYSVAFKQKMVERLTGRSAVSATELARKTGVSQEALSQWLRTSRTLLPMASKRDRRVRWSLHRKVEVLAAAAKLDGPELAAYLKRERIRLADFESWRLALAEGGTSAGAATRRIRDLERELARKDKALAEAAALLILKKKADLLFRDSEDDDTDEGNER